MPRMKILQKPDKKPASKTVKARPAGGPVNIVLGKRAPRDKKPVPSPREVAAAAAAVRRKAINDAKATKAADDKAAVIALAAKELPPQIVEGAMTFEENLTRIAAKERDKAGG